MAHRRTLRGREALGLAFAVLAMSFGILLTAPAASAFTYVSGAITVNTVWDTAGDPYILVGHVTVRPGVTLTIMPGTVVRFDPGLSLFVLGSLTANGFPTMPISFLANQTMSVFPPIGVQFNASATGSVSWSTFDRFDRPVSAVLSSPSVRDNTVGQASWAFSFYLSATVLADNTVGRASIGVYAAESNVQVLRNRINGTTRGIFTTISGAPLIADNRITNTSDFFAVGIYATDGVSPTILDNTVQTVRGTRGPNGVGPGAPGGPGGSAVGIFAPRSPSATVSGNILDAVVGGRGGDGAENASGTGGRGGDGGFAAGILIGGGTLDVSGNSLTNVIGGRGGNGGGSPATFIGGDGGRGGDAQGVQVYDTVTRASATENDMDGVAGGGGGNGGSGGGGPMDGSGGVGGTAAGMSFWNALDAESSTATIRSVRGGPGGNSTGLLRGFGARGGDVTGISVFDLRGSTTIFANDISDVLGGPGGRGQAGGAGGTATGVATGGRDDASFNATSITWNSIATITGGAGGPGTTAGGSGGGARGVLLILTTPSLSDNTLVGLQAADGGDALDFSGGGRGGDAVGFAAVLTPGGSSARDSIDTATSGAPGAGPPFQTSYGLGVFVAGNSSVTSRLTIDNGTLRNLESFDVYIENYTDAVTINTPFSEAKLAVQSAGNLTVRNFLGVAVVWPDGVTLVPGASILVRDNGATVWSLTSATGQESWLLVTDRVYINSISASENTTEVTVSYAPYGFTGNPRTVAMATTHTETFVMVDTDAPTSAAGPLPTYTAVTTFSVSYSASDGTGGGLADITLWYRNDGGGWTSYATQPAGNFGFFSFTSAGDGTYEFATTATDVAGNSESLPTGNDSWTIVDTTRPGSAVAPLAAWQTSASFLLSWAPDPGVTDIASYTVQYNNGGGWTDWLVGTTLTSATFTASPASGVVQFRSIATDRAGNTETPPAGNDTWTRVDTELPVSSVQPLPPWHTSLSFQVIWSSESVDVASYRIDVRENGGPWTMWIPATTALFGTYTGLDGALYEFRSIASDVAGNVETPPAGNDTWTRVDATAPTSAVAALPVYTANLTISITWGPTAGTTDIATYTIQVSDNGGPWTSLPGSTDTTAQGGSLSGLDGHRYAFRSIARDRAGNVEAGPATNDTWTLIDVTRPFVVTASPRGSGMNTTPAITMTFSEPMDRASVAAAFAITPDISGTFVWSGDDRTLTFVPDRALESNTLYTIAIDTGARDLAGNAASADYTFQFTTAALPPAPVDVVGNWWWLFAVLAGGGVAGMWLFNRFRKPAPRLTPPPPPAAAKMPPEESIVEDVFLLYRDGILIKHQTRRLKPDVDTDILTGMLTAVTAFVKDSFGRETEGELDEIKFGEVRIMIGRGTYIVIAAMVTGGNTQGMKSQIEATIHEIETLHWDQLDSWEGDMALAKTLDPYLKKLVRGGYA